MPLFNLCRLAEKNLSGIYNYSFSCNKDQMIREAVYDKTLSHNAPRAQCILRSSAIEMSICCLHVLFYTLQFHQSLCILVWNSYITTTHH